MKQNWHWFLFFALVVIFIATKFIMLLLAEPERREAEKEKEAVFQRVMAEVRSGHGNTTGPSSRPAPSIPSVPSSFRQMAESNGTLDPFMFLTVARSTPDVNEHIPVPKHEAEMISRHLQDQGWTNLLARSGDFITPLSIAVRQRFHESVRALLDRGADPNVDISMIIYTPLNQAILYQDLSIVSNLLAHGADPNRMDLCGNAVSTAVASWTSKAAIIAKQAGVEGQIDKPLPPTTKSVQETLLDPAFGPDRDTRSIEILDMVVKAGGNTEVENPYGLVPLVEAFVLDRFDVFVYLLHHVSEPEKCVLESGQVRYPLPFAFVIGGDKYLRYLKAMHDAGVDLLEPLDGRSILDLRAGPETKVWLKSISDKE